MKPDRGMLPILDPILEFPPSFQPYASLALRIPDLIKTGRIQDEVSQLDLTSCITFIKQAPTPQLQRAYAILATLHQACAGKSLLFPALELAASQLGIYPTQTYYSYIMQNWRRKDESKGMTFDNIDAILTFTNTPDERAFIITHVMCESFAGLGLNKAHKINVLLQNDRENIDVDELNRDLLAIANSIHATNQLLKTLKDKCKPQVFVEEIRPHLMSVGNFVGASGAQTCIFRILDRFVGIATDSSDTLSLYLTQDQRDMIHSFDPHRLNNILLKLNNAELYASRNKIIDAIKEFRMLHLRFVVGPYQAAFASDKTGTGGTDASLFLTNNIALTEQAKNLFTAYQPTMANPIKTVHTTNAYAPNNIVQKHFSKL